MDRDRADPPGTLTRRPEAASQERKQTRAQKSEAIRNALFAAAAEAVGSHGYQGAAIAQITDRANVALGSFYNYFPTRQHILDELLPALGQEMLAFVREQIGDAQDLEERERRGFTAFFDYLLKKPQFFRILNEAESFAPVGYKAHFRNIVENYLRAMRRHLSRGELRGYTKRELEVIVYMLLAARSYLALRYVYGEGEVRPMPAWVTRAYVKFVMYGLHGPANRAPRAGGGKAGRSVRKGRRREP